MQQFALTTLRGDSMSMQNTQILYSQAIRMSSKDFTLTFGIKMWIYPNLYQTVRNSELRGTNLHL